MIQGLSNFRFRATQQVLIINYIVATTQYFAAPPKFGDTVGHVAFIARIRDNRRLA
jgi:hypothetical protein